MFTSRFSLIPRVSESDERRKFSGRLPHYVQSALHRACRNAVIRSPLGFAQRRLRDDSIILTLSS